PRATAAGHEPTLTALPTRVKVPLALEPRAVMAAMQTTMINASMTAYSTAVGPSSRFRKSTANCASLCIRDNLPLRQPRAGTSNPCGCPRSPPENNQGTPHDEPAAALSETLLNVWLAREPSVVMAVMRTTMMRGWAPQP